MASAYTIDWPIAMKRPCTPEDSPPHKRRQLGKPIVPPEIFVNSPRAERGSRNSHFIFGNNDSKEFRFRCTLPPADSTQQYHPKPLHCEEGRGLENIKMSLLSEWEMKFEGPHFVLNAVLERIGLVSRLLSQESTNWLEHRGFLEGFLGL